MPKPRRCAKRVKNGNLIIGENHDQLGNSGHSETSSSADEDGLHLNLRKWKGETSRLEEIGVGKVTHVGGNDITEMADGLAIMDTNVRLQKASRSPSLESPLKEYLD